MDGINETILEVLQCLRVDSDRLNTDKKYFLDVYRIAKDLVMDTVRVDFDESYVSELLINTLNDMAFIGITQKEIDNALDYYAVLGDTGKW